MLLSPTDKMSVLQQVLTDARKLATRLRDHDSSADSLLTQSQGMFKQMESMKEVSTPVFSQTSLTKLIIELLYESLSQTNYFITLKYFLVFELLNAICTLCSVYTCITFVYERKCKFVTEMVIWCEYWFLGGEEKSRTNHLIGCAR